LGSALLHLHSTFSDGMSSVDDLLDEVEQNSDIDVIGITDHDDCRSFAAAQDWKARHPDARLQPIWGVELTVFGFTHVLAYKLQAPFPTAVPRKFMGLRKAINALNELGCYVVVPHVDAPVVGMGRRRLAREAARGGIFGYELFTPYFTSTESLPELQAIGDRHNLVALGGPDAHFVEDLYRVIVRFPGHTAAELEQSWHDRTVVAEVGHEGPKKTLRRKLQQQRRSLIEHPREQMTAWMHRRAAVPA
jgi:predicted metal-dependent phosphoesterase TrpH